MSSDVPLRDPLAFHGRVETRTIESELLRGNLAGDPSAREVPVYLPPGWDAAGARFPVLFVLSGFTGRGQKYLDTHPWKRGVVHRYDEAVAKGEAPPAILVVPDCFTKLGGSQYVDSAYLGPYESHVVRELVPWVDERYPTLPGRRGVVGKSSGGFGALHLAMRHPELFPVCASISGDCHFAVSYASSFLPALRGLVPHQLDPARFLAKFLAEPKLSGDDHAVIEVLAMSACYSPNPASPLGFDLPFDLATGERIPAVFERWLAFDPLVACERHAEALRGLELLHLECGMRDEFHLQWGLRVLSKKLNALGIPHDHEEHEAGHMDIDHRYRLLFPKLIRRLQGEA